MDLHTKNTSETQSDVFLFSNIEIQAGYFWKHLIFPNIKQGRVKISSRLFRKHINKYKPIIDYLIQNNYIKVSVGGEGGFRKGITTYDVLKLYNIDIMRKDIDYLSEKISKKHKRKHESLVNMSDVDFGDISELCKNDREIIEKLQNDGVKERIVTSDKLFWSEFCNLSKKARSQLSFDGKKFIEIDINASIPRLLVTYLYKKVEKWKNNIEIMDEIVKWTEIITEKDAYDGFIEYFGLNYSRDEFKKAFLPILFGAGTKDKIKQDIADEMNIKFPHIKLFLQNESQKYRFAKNSENSVKTWRNGLFCNEIFKIQARIVNKSLKKIIGKKYSVYDSIGVCDDVEKCQNIIKESWKNVVGNTTTYAVKINGCLRFAQDVSYVPTPETCKLGNKKGGNKQKRHNVLEGEGDTIISAFFEKVGTLFFDERKVGTCNVRGEPNWRYRVKNKIDKKKPKSNYTRDEFIDYIKQILEQ